MDTIHARIIVQSLADGIDPVTNQPFPPDSPYQQADIVRALHVVLTALDRAITFPEPSRRAGPSIIEPPPPTRNRQPANPRPVDPTRPQAGRPCTPAEDQQLRDAFAITTPNVNPKSTVEVLTDTFVKYRLEDIKGAVTPCGQLANILTQVESGVRLSNTLLAYLDRKGFFALMRLAAGKITYTDFLPIAEREQAKRRAVTATEEQRTKTKTETEERERERLNRCRLAREQNVAERDAQMRDPRYQAKVRKDELRQSYGLDRDIDHDDYTKVMNLVLSLDKGNRIQEQDFAWLSSQGGKNYHRYLTAEVECRYHEIEASFFVAEFKRTHSPWLAVSASKHLRKCRQSRQAVELLGGIEVTRGDTAKLRSALCTTLGGAKRDLGDLEAAFELGNQAHALTPQNYRPCTLLGAVSYERGDYDQGRTWYDKAVERGFDRAAVDGELRSIFWRLDPKKQSEMRVHLLGIDPVRYKWAASSVKRLAGPLQVERGR